MFKIDVVDNAAYITTPYNPEFVGRIKAMGGKWDASGKRWKVNAQSVDVVREAMLDVYGQNDLPGTEGELVTVVVTTQDYQYADHCAYTLFGKTIATAWGRDSGARVGEDVAFIEGKPGSGGSVKNWKTVIPSDSRFEIYNVPRAIYERDKDALPEGISAEIKPSAPAAKRACGIDALAAAIDSATDDTRRAILKEAYELVMGKQY